MRTLIWTAIYQIIDLLQALLKDFIFENKTQKVASLEKDVENKA